MTDRICVAQIGAAHGIRGEVQAAVVHRRTRWRSRPTVRWKARTARGASPSKRCGRRRITSSRGLPGVADRDAAEKLTNIKLYVSRDKLPPIEDDETFYHADLVGLPR